MQKKKWVILLAMVVLSGVTLLSLHASVSTEDVTKEEISDGDMESSLSGESKASLEVCQESEPILLEKTGQKTGQMAYSFSLKSLNEGIWHVSLLSGNPDVKFVRYVSLPEEDYLDSIEVGFEKNHVLRGSVSEHLSPDGTIPCNATKWLETPVEREVAGGEEVEIHLEFPVKLLPEEGVRPEGSNAWGMDGFSLYALLTDGQGQQALQEIRFEKQDGMSMEASVFSRDLEDVAEIETPSKVITKELHGYRYIYSSPEKVEPVYHCTHMDSATGTVLEGDLTLSHITQMGDAVYAYYDGTVTGVKEGNAFSELPHGQSV